jgi:hypothetical protein
MEEKSAIQIYLMTVTQNEVLIFYAAMTIGLVSLSMILQLAVLNMQGSVAMAEKKNYQQKLSQHNQCKSNSTRCMNVGSNGIPMSTNSPNEKLKGENTRLINSSNNNSQTDTPLLLPFP